MRRNEIINRIISFTSSVVEYVRSRRGSTLEVSFFFSGSKF